MLLACLFPAALAGNDDGMAYLAFSSDVHNNNSMTPSENSSVVLKSWIENVSLQLGKPFEQMGFCGDYGDIYVNEATYWSYAKGVFDTVAGTQAVKGGGFFAAGNHENDQGKLATTKNAAAKLIKRPGEKEIADDYVLYSFGAESTAMDTGFSRAAINGLREYLADAPMDRPIFILPHFPLHGIEYEEGGRNKIRNMPDAAEMVELLNDASKTHNIIFLWGHNHSKNAPMYSQLITSGDNAEIVIDTVSGTKAAIGFTYAAAGSMSSYETFSFGGNIRARGLVAAVNRNTGAVTLTYYDSCYVPFQNAGIPVAGRITAQQVENGLTVAYLPETNGDVLYAAAFYDRNGKMLAVHLVKRGAQDAHSASFVVQPEFFAWRAMVLDAATFAPLAEPAASPPGR